MHNDTNNTIGQSASILVVEDDEVTAYMLEYLLQREGYEVTCVFDGNQAKAAIEKNQPFSLVLLDIMLPYISGIELITHIRSTADGNRTAIIMISGKAQEKDIIRALDTGADDYIVKPFQPGEVLARIRKIVKPVKPGPVLTLVGKSVSSSS